MAQPIRVDAGGSIEKGRRPARVDSCRREQAIRRAAYYRWACGNCTGGHDVEDWIASEHDVDAVLAYRESMIRAAAYSRWRSRGRRTGEELADWLAAEREVDYGLARAGLLAGFFDLPRT